MTQEEFLRELPGFVKNYRPEPVVLQKIANLDLLMVVGPSGVGKTTLIQRSGITFVPSDTTRKPRVGEKEGVDYYFRRDYEKVIDEMKAGRFVQVAIGSAGDFYATKYSSFPKSGLATMPIVAGVIPIFRNLGFQKTISAFITPPSYKEWMRRMSVHPATNEQRLKRLAEAQRSFAFALSDDEIHFILNDKIETAVRQMKNLVKERVDKGREAKARAAATENYAKLLKLPQRQKT